MYHKHIIDLTNQKFDRLTVIRQDLSKSKKDNYWYCKCDCGNFTSVSSFNLRNKLTKSCGCLRLQCTREKSSRWSGYKHVTGSYWNSVKKGAKQRQLKVEITIQQASDLLEKQNFLCSLTGEPIHLAATKSEYGQGLQTASLDRIDSNKDYTLDNVRWVHRKVNSMKWDFNDQEFIDLCTKVSNNFPKIIKLWPA